MPAPPRTTAGSPRRCRRPRGRRRAARPTASASKRPRRTRGAARHSASAAEAEDRHPRPPTTTPRRKDREAAEQAEDAADPREDRQDRDAGRPCRGRRASGPRWRAVSKCWTPAERRRSGRRSGIGRRRSRIRCRRGRRWGRVCGCLIGHLGIASLDVSGSVASRRPRVLSHPSDPDAPDKPDSARRTSVSAPVRRPGGPSAERRPSGRRAVAGSAA